MCRCLFNRTRRGSLVPGGTVLAAGVTFQLPAGKDLVLGPVQASLNAATTLPHVRAPTATPRLYAAVRDVVLAPMGSKQGLERPLGPDLCVSERSAEQGSNPRTGECQPKNRWPHDVRNCISFRFIHKVGGSWHNWQKDLTEGSQGAGGNLILVANSRRG